MADFKVNDRRGRDTKPTTPTVEVDTFTPPAESTAEPSSPPQSKSEPQHDITFASFVLSLSTSALVHLGARENPISKEPEEDLEVAKQEIHILEILKEKTRGNLVEEESRLMEDVLFHLRMLYVEKTKK